LGWITLKGQRFRGKIIKTVIMVYLTMSDPYNFYRFSPPHLVGGGIGLNHDPFLLHPDPPPPRGREKAVSLRNSIIRFKY
jgi:hypothetical protein